MAFLQVRKFRYVVPSLMDRGRQGCDLNRTALLPLALGSAAASSGHTGRGRFLALLAPGWSHLSGFATGKRPALTWAICKLTHEQPHDLSGCPSQFVRPQTKDSRRW